MALIRFYRHAEALKNKDRNVVGGRSIESPLTAAGDRQSDDLGLALWRGKRRFVAAFASTACRATQTGNRSLLAAGLDLALQEREDLLEISQGIWEGKDRRKPLTLADGTTEKYTHPYSRGLHGRVTGGESIAETGLRIERDLIEIADPHKGSDAEIAVFGHDFALRCLRVHLEGEYEYIRQGVAHCSETTIALQGGRLAIVQFGVPMIDQ